MAVYVDQIKEIDVDEHLAKYGTLWCCMYADTLDELNKMADMIGLQRRHLRNHDHFSHYDLTPQMRQLAISYGAQSLTTKELIKKIRENAKG